MRNNCYCNSPWITAEHVSRIMPSTSTPSCCCPPPSIPPCCCQRNNVFLLPGQGINIDLKNVAEGPTSIELASLPINCSILRGALVKIDFSTIFNVVDEKVVQLLVALKRTCNGNSTTLQTYELDFHTMQSVPFSFTYTDSEICCWCGCCVYTVEIIGINVIGGYNVNKIKTSSTVINALVRQY